jgi:hypothetical protein
MKRHTLRSLLPHWNSFRTIKENALSIGICEQSARHMAHRFQLVFKQNGDHWLPDKLRTPSKESSSDYGPAYDEPSVLI